MLSDRKVSLLVAFIASFITGILILEVWYRVYMWFECLQGYSSSPNCTLDHFWGVIYFFIFEHFGLCGATLLVSTLLPAIVVGILMYKYIIWRLKKGRERG